jgi:hypothetical protein
MQAGMISDYTATGYVVSAWLTRGRRVASPWRQKITNNYITNCFRQGQRELPDQLWMLAVSHLTFN